MLQPTCMIPPPLLLVVGCLTVACSQADPTVSPPSPPSPQNPTATPPNATPSGALGALVPEPDLATGSEAGFEAESEPGGHLDIEAIEASAPALFLNEAPTPNWRFTDQTAAAGVAFLNWNGSERDQKRSILDSIGQGSAWLDDDLDGHLDLYVANGSSLDGLPDPKPTSRYFKNRGDGTFADASQASGLASTAWNNGVAAADFDNDGDTDLFVANWGPHSLYINDGAGVFTDQATERGLNIMQFQLTPWGSCAAWGDVDLDGHLDLYVGHYLGFDPANPPHGGATQNWKGMRDAYYGPTGLPTQRDFLFRSNGDGTFRDGSAEAGVAASQAAYSLGCVFVDINADGHPDLYVANDSQPNYLFVGNGTGQMRERGALSGLAYGEHGNAQAGMGVDAGDYDADGDQDLIVTNFDDDVNTLYRNQGRSFRDVTVATGLAGPTRNVLSWGVGFVDLDLDADLDLFIACGHVYPSAETDDPNTKYRQTNQVYLQAGGRMHLVPTIGPDVREVSRGAAFGDYDADGDVDIFVNNLNAHGTLMRNDQPEATGHWFEVALQGTQANRMGIGARVEIVFCEHTRSAERRAGQSFLSTNSPWLHFGLGDAEQIDAVHVLWPGGQKDTFGPFAANQRVVLTESVLQAQDE